ncbi:MULTISPECIES: acetate kinase [Peptoniphilus]|jgi:acetate kinase|uniref:acetate kinase n=2 Tax=Peptoniphilaceae TaxID=1570339 RepID=UPI000288822C|nr:MULTISPECIES: acetate kinase [Peptoniphilus]MBS6610574.1 acetate kinase [Peptoniphilus harei]MDU1954678.1 acetate kinase [Peptoniphilus lacydonensis]MDU2115826.1 acetate kinase [Peptoniphilus lacydonensis]MDU5275607.1 acetate kinase [Peptoniphilus lacydonensis]MDU5377174.1 acetate kinase [Peptoniphilus lacydonensis]
MKILVINCGSSSLKYQLIDMETEELMAKGLVERIGIEGSRIKHETIGKEKKTIETAMQDHKRALELVMESLTNEEYGAIKSLDEIDAVGHRVVHGGEDFAKSVIIDEKVLKGIEDNVEIAPLHNPPNIMGIKACQRLLPNVKQVAVFDTAFHQTMPRESYIYALPYEYYEKYKIRRFGFHGTSHKYITNRAAEMLGKDVNEVNLITCHLGNGSSICAVKNGKSIDTSMGFTPLEGLAMGTRCGDLDPAILPFLMEKENLSAEELNTLMNKKSGVLGISGVSSDFRDIETARDEGNERAKLALDIFEKRVRGYIGSYMTELDHVDGIVFTAGVGENSVEMRESIVNGLSSLGIKIDPERNNVRGEDKLISSDDSSIKVLVIPTNEELMIARDTKELVNA